jgi:hypothetical protein
VLLPSAGNVVDNNIASSYKMASSIYITIKAMAMAITLRCVGYMGNITAAQRRPGFIGVIPTGMYMALTPPALCEAAAHRYPRR